ncbi:MAG TPA: isopentenyl phosphate kinase [Ignavibacteriaceae bacterium]
MKVTFIKLGGSLITDKNTPYTARIDIIERLVGEISQALEESPDLRLLIGNGAGSFGHQSAAKYGTADGFSDSKGRFGFAYVQNDAVRLNRIVVEKFLDKGIAAVGFQPSAIMVSSSKKPVFVEDQVIRDFLKKDLIPVLYGDTIIDREIGSTIFSTDKVIELIASKIIKDKEFEAQKMLSVGDYDGVMDDTGTVIPMINEQNFEEVSKFFYDSGKVDVTGGMAAKVKELLELSRSGIPSQIINGSVENRLYKALKGEEVLGTVIK